MSEGPEAESVESGGWEMGWEWTVQSPEWLLQVYV